MNGPHPVLPRRLLLASGAALLVSGCGSSARTTGSVRTTPTDHTLGAAQRTAEPQTGVEAAAVHDWSMPTDLPTAQLPAPSAAVPALCTPATTSSGTGPLTTLPCDGTSIALTLDDGPSTQWTERMLALLDHYQIPATFSLIGRQVVAHPGLVGEIVAAGHTLANHTWSHPDLARLPGVTVQQEILKAQDAIGRAAGRRPTLFRAPGGAWSRTVLGWCRQEGLRALDWSVDPRDWSRPGTHRIAEVILRDTRPGSIILEHDGGGDRRQTYEALCIALPRLLDAGYTFVTP